MTNKTIVYQHFESQLNYGNLIDWKKTKYTKESGKLYYIH